MIHLIKEMESYTLTIFRVREAPFLQIKKGRLGGTYTHISRLLATNDLKILLTLSWSIPCL